MDKHVMSNTERALKALREIASPPSQPVCAGSPVLWDSLRIKCGIRFPDDYVALTSNYGACGFTDFLVLLNPFIDNSGINIFSVQSLYRETFLENDSNGVKIFSGTRVFEKYKKEMERNELLPSVSTGNGDQFFWIASPNRNPNNWKTLAVGRGGDQIDEIDAPITEILVGVFTRRMGISFFPDDFWPNDGRGVVSVIPAKEMGSFTNLDIFPLDGAKGLPEDYISRIARHSQKGYLC